MYFYILFLVKKYYFNFLITCKNLKHIDIYLVLIIIFFLCMKYVLALKKYSILSCANILLYYRSKVYKIILDWSSVQCPIDTFLLLQLLMFISHIYHLIYNLLLIIIIFIKVSRNHLKTNIMCFTKKYLMFNCDDG